MTSWAEPLSEARIEDLALNLLALYDALGEDWVFGGVVLRADFEYIENVEDAGPWMAMAVKTNNTQLGPIPEVRGYGRDMVSAIVGLRLILSEKDDD